MSKEELIEFEGLVIETCMGRISESDNETHCALAPCDRRCLNFGGAALPKSYPRAAVSGIRVVRSDGINRQVSDARIGRVRPIFVAAFAAAMLPACTQSCDALSRGEQFSIATDLFAHPASIYWRDWLFSKKHHPSSHAC